MDPSSPIRTNRLPEKADGKHIWKNVDTGYNSGCFDGVTRECGTIHITPSILDVVETPIPEELLGQTISKIDLTPFLGFNDFGMIYAVESESANINSQLWSRNPISEFLPVDQAETVEDDLVGLCLINSTIDRCIFKRNSESSEILIYDLESEEILESIDAEDITFFDVPDAVLIENIDDKYVAHLISHSI